MTGNDAVELVVSNKKLKGRVPTVPQGGDGYRSPLVARNASPEMSALFSDAHRVRTWRRVWIALAEAQRRLGLKIPARAIRQMRATADTIDWAAAARYEKTMRHDLMAHVHIFGEAAPAARGIIHLGATSADIADNADLIILRDALIRVRHWLVNVIDALARFARRHQNLPAVGFTHFQPAQLTTVGKRACLWCYDFVRDYQEVEQVLGGLRFRGIKGATGTQASFLALFDDDPAKVARLERMVAAAFGFQRIEPVTGQTYSRKVDARIVAALAGIATSVHKLANDVRLLANLKEMEEPFEAHQVGSSSMAYKRNPMRCERATGLARLVISLTQSAFQTAAEQWLERTLDDSSNRRVVLPEAFLATDGMLRLVANVARGLIVYPRPIAARIASEMAFMSTEDVLMAAVKAGANRQRLHETIRRHSHRAARRVKIEGKPPDLIERLRSDPELADLDWPRILDARRYTGLAGTQVRDFLREHVAPILRRHRRVLGMPAELEV